MSSRKFLVLVGNPRGGLSDCQQIEDDSLLCPSIRQECFATHSLCILPRQF